MSNVELSSSESHFSGFSDQSSSDSDESELRVSRLRSAVHSVKKPDNSVKRSSDRPTQKSSDRQTYKSSDRPNQKSSDTGNQNAKISSKNLGKKSVHSESSPGFDFSKLSSQDIQQLKSILGVANEIEDEPLGGRLEDMPNIHVNIDNDDIEPQEMDFSEALFGKEDVDNHDLDYNDSEWELPKLKTPSKGKPVSQSLADLINTACVSQCDIDSFTGVYQIPENCDMAGPPSVNQEVWKTLSKRAHMQDKALVDIQNLVSVSLAQMIKLTDVLKSQMAVNKEAKKLSSDIFTVLGQIQYNLSIRRRYLIRPSLTKKYSSLCNVSMPITTKLFGDDIGKEIKNCESVLSLTRKSFNAVTLPYSSRGRPSFRGRWNGPYRGAYGGGYGDRFHPYQSSARGISRGFSRPRGGKRTATATVTSPNE